MLITSGLPRRLTFLNRSHEPNPSANPKWLGAPVCSGVVSQPACWLSSAGYPRGWNHTGLGKDRARTSTGVTIKQVRGNDQRDEEQQ